MPRWTKEQEEAINKEGMNIIVSAGAGSGKTAVLTERVITKIKKGIPVDHLLILTFTKAAASEMKERIRASIKKMNNEEELNKLDSAYITTFDSFSLSIVKKYHYLLNVSKNINIGNDNVFKLKKEQILDEIFEELYQEKNPEFLKLIGDFCVKDDLEIRDYILSIREKLDMKVDSKEFLDNYLNNYYNESFMTKIISSYNDLLINKIEELKLSLEEFSYYVDGTYYTKVLETLNPLLESTDYLGIKENLNIKFPSLPRGSEDVTKEKKECVVAIIKSLKDLVTYEDEEDIKTKLKSTYDYANIIVFILQKIDQKIKKFKFENDIYEFNDIAILAINLLKDNKEVREELTNYFSEILIDEYQDTSDIQETFINLISNNNVYMVGDIKQSIYRFRNANPYIFKNKYDNYSNHLNGEKIDLNKNFRSRSEVINNINLMFNYIMNDNIGGADYKTSHQMVFGNTAYNNNEEFNMQILTYDHDKSFNKNEIEAFLIAKDIKNKINNKYQVFDKKTSSLRDATYNDFVILMDRTTDFELYKKIFEYQNIPLAIYKDETLNGEVDTTVLCNLLCLIKAIKERDLSTKFKYLFTSIARSFLFRLSDQEIYDIIKNNTIYQTDIFIRCQKISNKLDAITPLMLVEEVINEFNFYENIIKIGNIESSLVRIDYTINLSKDLMNLGYDAYKFIDYLKEINDKDYQMKYHLSTSNIDAVKIMTIHKSKGLEYPVCYFSGLYKSFNISDLKEKILFDNELGIILPFYDEGIGENITKLILKNNYIKEEISEKIRLFYVALTRAREKMILVLPNKDLKEVTELKDNLKLKYRSLADIIYSLGNKVEEYETKIDIANLNLTKDYNIISEKTLTSSEYDSKLEVKEIKIDSKSIESQSFSKKTNKLFTKEEQNNIKLGLEMHSILENIDFHNPHLELIANSYYKNMVENFLSRINIDNDTKVYQEHEFEYEENGILYHGIIDLILEYSDYIMIVDYKLKHTVDDAYKNQIGGYKKYLEKITNKRIETYLYSIIDSSLNKIEGL